MGVRKVFIYLCLLLNASFLQAHEGHKHARAQEDKLHAIGAKMMTELKLEELVRERKLAKHWRRSQILDARKEKMKEQMAWVIRVQENVSKPGKARILHVFLTEYGDLITTNFTGR